MNEVVSRIFVRNMNERSNASQIINSNYFSDLKNKIINERYYIVDPFLVCLYEFENFEIEICLEHINTCINFYLSDNDLNYLSKFFLLKMKVLIYTNQLSELSNFVHKALYTSYYSILEKLIENEAFSISFYSLLVQCDFLTNSQQLFEDMKTLNDKVSKQNLVVDNVIQYTYYESVGIAQSKTNDNDSIIKLEKAINIYCEETHFEHINMTFEYARMNYYLGTIYSKVKGFDKALEHFNNALKFFKLKENTQLNDFYIKILINKLNLLKRGGLYPSIQQEVAPFIELCSNLLGMEGIKFSKMCTQKLYFKFQSILMNELIKSNLAKANQIIFINRISFENLSHPSQMNQVAYYYYSINNFEESLKFLNRAASIWNKFNLPYIDTIALICNKCMILYLLGLHDECKKILNSIDIDLTKGILNKMQVWQLNKKKF